MNCIACASPSVFKKFRMRTPYLRNEELYDIYQCKECGHSSAQGKYTSEYLNQIYSTGFHDTAQQASSSDENAPVRINAQDRVHWLVGLGLTGSLLDIGAGKGYFVEAAAENFDAVGIEYSPEATKMARNKGLNIIAGDFVNDKLSLPYQKFDVIALWDVLSCFNDPHTVIQKLERLLADNGRLVMTLPDPSSLIARVAGRFWPMWIPPVSMQYFSTKSIIAILKQYKLDLVSADKRPKKVAVSFLWAKFFRSLRLYKVASFSKYLPQKMNVSINTHDIITVVVKKQ